MTCAWLPPRGSSLVARPQDDDVIMRGIMQKMPRVDARRVGRERNRISAGGDDGDDDGPSRFDLLVAERDVMREPKVFL